MMSVISETKIQFISCQIGEPNLTAPEYWNFSKGIRSRCLIFWAFICDLCAFLTVALIFFSGGFFKINLRSRHIQKATYIYIYVGIYTFTSMPMKAAADVVWAVGLRYWSRGTQWWSTQRPGRTWASWNTVVENACIFLNRRWETKTVWSKPKRSKIGMCWYSVVTEMLLTLRSCWKS